MSDNEAKWSGPLLALLRFQYQEEISGQLGEAGDDSEITGTWKDLEGKAILTAQISRSNMDAVLDDLVIEVEMTRRPEQVLSKKFIETVSEMTRLLQPPD